MGINLKPGFITPEFIAKITGRISGFICNCWSKFVSEPVIPLTVMATGYLTSEFVRHRPKLPEFVRHRHKLRYDLIAISMSWEIPIRRGILSLFLGGIAGLCISYCTDYKKFAKGKLAVAVLSASYGIIFNYFSSIRDYFFDDNAAELWDYKLFMSSEEKAKLGRRFATAIACSAFTATTIASKIIYPETDEKGNSLPTSSILVTAGAEFIVGFVANIGVNSALKVPTYWKLNKEHSIYLSTKVS